MGIKSKYLNPTKGGPVKPKGSSHCSLYSIVDGIDGLEFAKRVSKEIMRLLHDPACSCPIKARKQWAEMNQADRLAFVSASLVCFYWIYIARNSIEQSIGYRSWQDSTIDEQIETAANFCSYLLATECEPEAYDGFPNNKSISTEWVN